MIRILSIGVLLLFLVGCSIGVRPLESSDSATSTPTPGPTATSVPTIVDDGAPAGTWIYPGKVEVSNLYPGARAEGILRVHNGGSDESTFRVYYEDLNRDSGEYVRAPDEVPSWVDIGASTMIIDPGETRDVLVAVVVPEDAVVDVKAFGFLVVVEEAGQRGNVQVRQSSKWLVGMR